MTVLSAQTIRARGIFSPFCERTRHPRTGTTFGLGPAGYDVRLAESLRLAPGCFSLASTVEHFYMPDDCIAFVHDKSTLARMGLAVQNTVIEPGWRGHLTLELTCHGDQEIGLEPGDPVAQIVLHLLDQPTEQPYAGRYQDQAAGPQPASRLMRDE